MNILFTSLGYIDDLRHRSTVRSGKSATTSWEAMPAERLLSYLRLTSASLAHIDVIVCNADTEPDGMPKLYTLDKAVRIANEVADLPEFIAQRDGRKWKMIPFFIIGERAFHFEQVSDLVPACLYHPSQPAHRYASTEDSGTGRYLLRPTPSGNTTTAA